jgi:hypothetical protein
LIPSDHRSGRNVTTGASVLADLSGAVDYAPQQTQIAADSGIRIFATSVGAGADQSLMQQIADIPAGEHFHAEGSNDEYSQQLESVFQRLGGTRLVESVE